MYACLYSFSFSRKICTSSGKNQNKQQTQGQHKKEKSVLAARQKNVCLFICYFPIYVIFLYMYTFVLLTQSSEVVIEK